MVTSMLQDNMVPNTLVHRRMSLATTNLTNVVATPTRLYSLIAQNTSAAKKYVKIYDKATAPVLASDTPIMTVELAVGATVNIPFNYGLKLANGLSYAITGGIADTDATAVVLNDVLLTAVYRVLPVALI